MAERVTLYYTPEGWRVEIDFGDGEEFEDRALGIPASATREDARAEMRGEGYMDRQIFVRIGPRVSAGPA